MRASQVSQHPRIAGGSCLTSHTARKTVIYDHPGDGRCYIRVRGDENAEFDFTLHNATGQPFHFVQVDKCMFSDEADGSRCDCLLFTEAVALFVEFKSNKSVSGRQKGRRKATDQLQASIEWFLAESLLADSDTVEAILANGTRKRHPRFTSNTIEKTLELQEQFPNLVIRYNELPFYKL
ncbi:MAG: hypothetical protein ACRYFX_10765 [Janthinobacterium lividum]